MPKRLEQALQRRAAALRLPPERRDAYVYGTLERIKKEKADKQAGQA